MCYFLSLKLNSLILTGLIPIIRQQNDEPEVGQDSDVAAAAPADQLIAGPSSNGRDRVAAVVVADGTGSSGAPVQDEIVMTDRIVVEDDYRGRQQATTSRAIKSKAKVASRARESSPEYRVSSDGQNDDEEVSVVNVPELDPSILDSD